MEIVKRLASFFLDIIETIVVALALFVVVYLFFFQPHQVKGASMEPNFHDGEYILTDKITYRFQSPKRGDVVVFKAPRNPDLDYIKRVIALSGETIKISNGRILIDGQEIEEEYLQTRTVVFPNAFLKEDTPYKVADGEYIVMGDSRSHSSDSREWGPIEKKEIIGRAFFRYWPLDRFGLVAKVNYNFKPQVMEINKQSLIKFKRPAFF